MNNEPRSSNHFIAYFQIIRPLNCFFGSLTIIIGMLNANVGSNFFTTPNSILTLIGGLCVYILTAAASNVINDVFDIEIDTINRPNRPIPSGKIRKKNAIIYASLLMGLGLIISIPLGLLTPNPILIPILVIFFGFIGFLYSWKGKRSGFLGNIIVGFAFSFGIPFGALLISPILEIPPHLWFFYATAMFLLISRELVKAMEDIEGDSKYNVKTVANLKGFKFTAWISGIFSVAAILTFTLPAIIYHLNIWFMILMGIGNVFVLVSIIFLIHPDRKVNQTRASLALKIGAYIGLIAYVLAIF
ncbi:MAG: geranylgeranylglycerol-phosphate geranylgeranyltransferase [Promethearchaeota archaeon]